MAAPADRVRRLTGAAEVTGAQRVPGGDICDAWRVTLRGGGGAGGGPERTVFAKTLAEPPPGFFEAEAAGLALLGGTGAVAVPEVLAVGEDVLVLEWVEPEAPTPALAERLGRDLAALHGVPASSYGTPGRTGYLGTLPLPDPGGPGTGPGTGPGRDPGELDAGWPDFHAEHRLLPLLRRAVDGGTIATADARDVERLCEEIGRVAGPPQPPAVIHGDLWSGNVHWSPGRARLIDPAAQGGHPETDLALLELFGCPELSRILAAYEEVRPLQGRARRVPLHQLQHLLVHAVLFGAGYGAQCGAAARAALGEPGRHRRA